MVLAWYFSRLVSKGYLNKAIRRRLNVLEAISLGPGKQVCLLQIDDKVLVLGVTSHHINLLNVPQNALSSVNPVAVDGSGPNFKEIFDNFKRKFKMGGSDEK